MVFAVTTSPLTHLVYLNVKEIGNHANSALQFISYETSYVKNDIIPSAAS